MSKIIYTADDRVTSRTGEFYHVSSCYTTPRSVHASDTPGYCDDPIFAYLEMDVDELLNKPRRFFDHLLSIMEYKRDHDPNIDKGNIREAYDSYIQGCELWLSAVENGLMSEAVKLAEPMPSQLKRHKEMRHFYE